MVRIERQNDANAETNVRQNRLAFVIAHRSRQQSRTYKAYIRRLYTGLIRHRINKRDRTAIDTDRTNAASALHTSDKDSTLGDLCSI